MVAADRVLADIHATLRTLVASPNIGRRRSDVTSCPLRFHPVRKEYLIAYAPDEDHLWVVAVIHGRRNPRVLAAFSESGRNAKHSGLQAFSPFQPQDMASPPGFAVMWNVLLAFSVAIREGRAGSL